MRCLKACLTPLSENCALSELHKATQTCVARQSELGEVPETQTSQTIGQTGSDSVLVCIVVTEVKLY